MSWEKALQGKKALVTGAGGFIGRHLVHRLRKAGAVVHATSRRAQDAAEGSDVHWHRVDLGQADEATGVMRRVEPDLVFHLASHVAGSRDLSLVTPTFDANLASTVHLLKASAELGIERFVQVGSLEEPEDLTTPPSSPYAAAKAAASLYSRMFHLLYEVPVVIARVFMVYGPGPQDEKKLVPYVIRSLMAGETPSFGSGTRPVDWVFAPDIAEGFMRLATAPGLAGQRVDLGTGQLVTVRGMVEEVFRQLAPGVEPSFGGLADRQAEQVRKADIERTHDLLGWHPETDVERGIERTIEWFRHSGAFRRQGAERSGSN